MTAVNIDSLTVRIDSITVRIDTLTVDDDVSFPAAGGFWPDEEYAKERKRRRKEEKYLDDLLRRAAGEDVPDDVPEDAEDFDYAPDDVAYEPPPELPLPTYDPAAEFAALQMKAFMKAVDARKAQESKSSKELQALRARLRLR